MCSSPCYCSWFGHWCKVWVRFRLGIAISTTQHRLRACKLLAPCCSPRARAFHLHLACTLSSSALRIRRLPPQIPLDRRLPPRSQVDLAVAPQNHRPRLKHRPRRIGRHQKRKTPLVYVARVAHRPCLQLQSAEQPQSAPLAQRAAAIINGETTLSLLPASMTLEIGRKFPMFWETWTGTGETDRKTSSILGDLDPDDIMRTLVGSGWLELM